MDGLVGSPFLGIGTIFGKFPIGGKTPDFRYRLNSFVTLGEILEAVSFNILAEMPSALVDLVALRDDRAGKLALQCKERLE